VKQSHLYVRVQLPVCNLCVYPYSYRATGTKQIGCGEARDSGIDEDDGIGYSVFIGGSRVVAVVGMMVAC